MKDKSMEYLMEYAININPVLPVRAEASEKSEMVTQLLFGEMCIILEDKQPFTKIKNHLDGYEGWVDTKMLTPISISEYEKTQASPTYKICTPLAEIQEMKSQTTYRLTAGSLIQNMDADTNISEINGLKFYINPKSIKISSTIYDKNKVKETASIFLNTPYLWGGKSIMGIDCSGFVQVVYSLNGKLLPRDASEQARIGTNIIFDEIQVGDIMLFVKEEKVSHVGIYVGNGQIIHASGKVRIDYVDEKGIFNKENINYTHFLYTIRRIE